jgi:hypothetical protein
MLHDQSSGKSKENLEPEEYKQDVQKEVKVLKTDKANNNTSPLHGSLSEKPEDENTAVRDQDRSNDK